MNKTLMAAGKLEKGIIRKPTKEELEKMGEIVKSTKFVKEKKADSFDYSFDEVPV